MTEPAANPAITVETPLIAAFDAHVLLDARLSWKAKGLAAILLSTGTWAGNEDIATDDLIALGADGRDAILAGLRELENAGYLTRTRRTGEGGRIYWQRVMRARPVTANPAMDSLDSVSSDTADNASTDASTDGATVCTIDGKSGHGADSDLTRARTHTDQDIYNSPSNAPEEEEEELSDPFSTPNDRSSSSSTQGDRARDQGAGSLDSVSSEKPDPIIARLCRDILTACGVRVAADHLYPRHQFEKIRAEAVRYMAEYNTGYQRERNAGVLVHRIKNAVYVPLTEDERMSSHYLQWRTEAERQADQVALVERTYEVPSPPAAFEPPVSDFDPQIGFSPSAVWRQLQSELAIEQGGSFDRWVNDTWVIAYEDGEFLIGLPDAFRYDWIVHRLSRQIKRKLAVITANSRVDVKFRVQPKSLQAPAAVH